MTRRIQTPKKKERTPPSEDEQALFAWRKDIPLTGNGRPLARTKLVNFVKKAAQLISLRNDSIRQEVITSLASEGGLLRLSEVLEVDYDRLSPNEAWSSFETLTLPLLQTITHQDVLSSLVLERSVGNLFVFIYGINGRRGVAFFTAISNVIQKRLAMISPTLSSSLTPLVVTALLKVLEFNQGASTIPEICNIVDTIEHQLKQNNEGVGGTLLEQAAVRELSIIRRHLQHGSSMEPPLKAPAKERKHVAHIFELAFDGPGETSTREPRHNNDHSEISRIKILPTPQEIRSERAEYLPSTDHSHWHIPGIYGLIDRQFRLLREDTVGQLRDCVGAIMNELDTKCVSKWEKPKNANLHTFRYSGALLSDVIYDEKRKLKVMASFDQPRHLIRSSKQERAAWWRNCKQLQEDSLVCLLDTDGNTLFFTVDARRGFASQKKKSGPKENGLHPDGTQGDTEHTEMELPDLWSDPKRATITLRLIHLGDQPIATMLGRDWKLSSTQQVLVEFPGVLLPAFKPTLQALQRMSRTPNVPFADVIIPDQDETKTEKHVGWPAYAQQPGFYFNMGPITQDQSSLLFSHRHTINLAQLQSQTTLDESQCKALIGCLSRSLALVQGPPGTGKSFVAVQTVRVLLESREMAKMNPIICVCYTNHALDQFLEQMLEAGISQIIRIGGGSKSAKLTDVNLRTIASQQEATKMEKRVAWQLRTDLETEGNAIQNSIHRMKRTSQSQSVLRYLQDNHPKHFQELTKKVDAEGFQMVDNNRGDVLQRWLKGSPEPTQDQESLRPLEELWQDRLSSLSTSERQRLYNFWVSDLREELEESCITASQRFVEVEESLRKCYQQLDLRCLKEAHVIGITTSGLAKNLEVLRRLKPKVLICEEAGEILEAHTLTAFLPTIEHAILIGDHQQLRPQIQSYDLSLESTRGQKYSFDISTFERLICTPELELPHDTLQTQRRMDPSISRLIRNCIYPHLMDHDSVIGYPEVKGMRKRLFWLDHRQNEVEKDSARILSSSHSNDYEIDIVEAIALHLVRQSTYNSGDIAILTPYVRQLQKLRDRLGKTFEIVIGEKDADELSKEDLSIPKTDVLIPRRTTLTQHLRIATVDNFQGEEAKVVIVSLVRSNQEGKIGFLRTTNRINVLLSRAKHGMYIIGDSSTASVIPMWANVIQILKDGGNIGFSLPLCCPQHPDRIIEVQSAEHIHTRAPEGGCDLPCNLRLNCGHKCTFKCHSTDRHSKAVCQTPCPRRHEKCQHVCQKACGVPCGKCRVRIEKVQLPCGHDATNIECHETEDLGKIQCRKIVEKEACATDCGHKVPVECSVDTSASDFKCTAPCGSPLPCGHLCKRKCWKCRTRSEVSIRIEHGSCDTICGRPYTTCSHSCVAPCHGEAPCRPCTQKCNVQCPHSSCGKLCQQPCSPCAEKCTAGCEHEGRKCTMPCAVPCNFLPCSRRCGKTLSCAHQCPSLCGETCPDSHFCQICAKSNILNLQVDYLTYESYREVDLDKDPVIIPPCGHIITMSSMDGLMGMKEYYAMSTDEIPIPIGLKASPAPLTSDKPKVCPACRGPLLQIHRYNRMVKRALLDESTKRFIIWSNAEFVPLTERMRKEEVALKQRDVFLGKLSNNVDPQRLREVRISGPRTIQMHNIRNLSGIEDRLGSLLKLHEDIGDFLSKVGKDEQPYARVYAMAQESQHTTGQSSEFCYDKSVLQTRIALMTSSLFLRCEFKIVSELMNIRQNVVLRRHMHPWIDRPLRMDLATNRQDCLQLLEEARSKDQPMVEVEASLEFAKFAALERTTTTDQEKATNLMRRATEVLEQAKFVVDRSHQARSMLPEIEAVEGMLQEDAFYTAVTSEERQSVYQAMAQELQGTGHWYHCVNMHPFTIGECGAPMETAQCPQCGAPVGGRSHQLLEGVTRATDLEREFGQMNV